MRVVQLCTDFVEGGGIQTHVVDLSRWLRAKGHRVIFAGQPGFFFDSQYNDETVSLPMWGVTGHFHDGSVRRIFSLIQAAAALRKFLKTAGADLIHAHETAPALVARLATIGLKIPVIMTFHGSEPERIANAARIGRYCTTLTASPSERSLDALVGQGLPPEKTRILGLGIRPMPEVDPSAVNDLRQFYLGGQYRKLILSLSRLHYQKGIDIMIEVVRRVVALHPDVLFVIAGNGPLAPVVEQWADSAGVGGNIRFVGSVETVPLHLAAADMMLLTSRWEALPISIVEAFRAARPVVATDCGGVSELVDDTVGALCPVGDVDALADAVIKLLGDDGLRAKKGEAALARSAEDRFDPEKVHANIETVYLELVGRCKS